MTETRPIRKHPLALAIFTGLSGSPALQTPKAKADYRTGDKWLAMGLLPLGLLGALMPQQAHANATYHSLATSNFSQDWSNTGLITTNDDWANVPSIIGFLGDDAATTTGGVNPQTITVLGTGTADVIANQTNTSITNGGVAEFAITNPSIALQGSGTADYPFILLHLDATNRQAVTVNYNLRDLDGSADNAAQPIAVQYRVGTSGNFIDLPSGYTADATTGPSIATQTTAVSVTLPAAANNQAQVQVRIITANASGNDEWVGIDDISVSSSPLSALPGVTISQSGGDTAITEGGATDSYTVVLDNQPTADVTVNIAADTQVTTSTSTLSFTSANWNVPQTVTVTAVDDPAVENAHTGTVSHTATSSDASYNGITIGSVTANITDNDTPVTPNVNLSVSANTGSEAGATAITVTATASAAVTGAQTVTVVASGAGITGGDYNLSGTTITIPNGSTTGSVTFTIVDDALVEGTETATLTISTPSAGIVLGATTTQSVTITDNDTVPNACGDPATKISAVQGGGNASPLSGVAGTSIEGIVIGDYQGTSATSLRGFFVQEEDADSDGNPATSEGIFVFDGTNGNPSVSVGDKVRVTGTPTEFFNMTQFGTLTSVQVCATAQALPTPATLMLPVPNVPNGNLAMATDAINAYYEQFEGMLVTFPMSLKVSEYFELERYGQLLLSQGGRIPTFTNVSNPSATGYINHQIKLAKRQIILDDKNNTQNAALANNTALFYPTDGPGGAVDGLSVTNRLRGGDTIDNLTGVLHWSFAGFTGTDAWRIRPVDEIYDYVFTSANKRKATPPDVGGALRVASFNVLNFFTGIDAGTPICGPGANQDCRGADSSVELGRQKAKAGAALCGLNADIIGLMEVENNTSLSLQGLADAANQACGSGTYDFINTGTIGSDAIKVGLLYKTATVSPVNSHAILTSSFNANFIDTKNRPSLAQTFEEIASGERLTIAVNHLKSKGSDCLDVGDPDMADGQGNCNQTRTKAAEVLVDWLATHPTGIVDPDYLLIGDLNSYAKEDPVKAIEKGPDNTAGTVDDYTNLVKKFGGTAAYSYVFDGQTGYLDHALASASLASQVTGAGDWHINADEPPSFDYNDAVDDGAGEQTYEVKPSATTLYAPNQYRTSDHDPVVIGIKLAETINTIDGTPAKDTLTGTAGKDRITGFAGADSLTGGDGSDEFVFTAPTEGIDTITDFTLGTDKIDLDALLLAIGYQGNSPIADGIVQFANSGSHTVLYVDPDGSGTAAKRALAIVLNVSAAALNDAANFKF